jgi:5-methylcytosine-specific restriction endonuclease McrA
MPKFKKIYKPEEITTKKNVVAIHNTSNWLNNLLHEKKNNEKYYIGLTLLGRNTFKKKDYHIFSNYTYTIQEIQKDKKGNIIYVLDDGYDKHYVPKTSMESMFKLSYSITCHSSQGFTINEKYTVFDINHWMVTSKWLWVAITRNTNLENVTLYMSKPPSIDYKMLDRTIKDRIIGHLHSDVNREINGEYIDVAFVKEKLFKIKKCRLCRNVFDLMDGESWSIDRINNDFAHVKDNCQIICRNCNVRKK